MIHYFIDPITYRRYDIDFSEAGLISITEYWFGRPRYTTRQIVNGMIIWTDQDARFRGTEMIKYVERLAKLTVFL